MGRMVGAEHAICSRCKEIKGVREFGKDASRSTGLSIYCVRCRQRPMNAIVVQSASLHPKASEWGRTTRERMTARNNWNTRVFVVGGDGRVWVWGNMRRAFLPTLDELLALCQKEGRKVKFMIKGERGKWEI
jgi:hypothetical protein